MLRILTTGDRDWTDRDAIQQTLERFRHVPDVTLIHGAARGADRLAASVAKDMGWTIESYPAKWLLYGPGAGPIRNKQMLDTAPDRVIYIHDDLGVSKGTKDCVEQACARGIPVMSYARVISKGE